MQKVSANSFHLHKAQIMSGSVTLPDSFQVVVVGTGLVESIVAAAAARNGQSVLHIDTAGYYGGDFASFSLEGLNRWMKERGDPEQEEALDDDLPQLAEGEQYLDFGHFKTVENIKESWDVDIEAAESEAKDVETVETKDDDNSNEEPAMEARTDDKPGEKKWNKEELIKESRRFNIDLTPKLLYARGGMVELLISSNISRYTEFKSVTRVLTQIDGRLEHVPSSRADVFGTKHISVVEKRILMKFLSYVNEKEDFATQESENKFFRNFLKQHKLTDNLIHFVVHSIAMVKADASTALGVQQTKKFLSSLGRFGSTPFLWSMYGSGELPQAFCRLCAVFGGVYYLGRNLSKLIVKEGKCIGLVTEGKRIDCEYLLLSDSYTPNKIIPDQIDQIRTRRCIYITNKSLLATEKEQVTLLSLPSQNPVYVIEVGPGTAACPRGLQVVHGSCKDEGEDIDGTIRSVLQDKSILYSASFIQKTRTGNISTTLENVYRAGGPQPELDFDSAVQQSGLIYAAMFPDQPFLPRAPDPEEIIIGDEEENSPEEKSGDAIDGDELTTEKIAARGKAAAKKNAKEDKEAYDKDDAEYKAASDKDLADYNDSSKQRAADDDDAYDKEAAENREFYKKNDAARVEASKSKDTAAEDKLAADDQDAFQRDEDSARVETAEIYANKPDQR